MRLNVKKLRETVTKELFEKENSSYKYEMEWALTVEGVRQKTSELGKVICNIVNEDR